MVEEIERSTIKRAIKEQNKLGYFSYAFIDEKKMFSDIDKNEFKFSYYDLPKFLLEHPEILDSWSMNNLVYLLGTNNKELMEIATKLIMQKFRNGEHVFSGTNAEFQFIGDPINVWDRVLYNLGKNNAEEIKKSILNKVDELKEKDERAFNFVCNLRKYSAIDSFLDCYEKGYITPEKLDYLEKTQAKNPNITDKMSYALMQDEIFSMGEEFVTRIARFHNMTAKLVKILESSPKLFETIKKGIIDLEENTEKPEALEIENIVLSYALDNFTTSENLSFEELVELGIEKVEPVTVKTENGIEIIDTNDGANSKRDAIHKAYDIKKAYAQNLVEKVKQTANTINSSDDIQYVEFGEKKVKQINLHGNFSVLAHSSDSGFKEDKKIIDGDFEKTWLQKNDVSAHLISTCLMNQDFMGCVPAGSNGVLMMFSDLKTEDVALMGPMDINSHIRNYGMLAARPIYMKSEDLPQYARRVYAEVPVEEKKPDFILIFDDTPEEVLNNSYKSALDFDIPVVYIDKKEVEKNQLDRLDDLIEHFKETQDIEDLQKLISTYETNSAGWLLNRSKAEEDDSLTSGINNERFREDFESRGKIIFDLIQNYITERVGNLEANQELSKVLQILQLELDKYELSNKENVPISKTSSMLDYQVFIDKVKSLGIEKDDSVNIKKPVDITSIAVNAVQREGLKMSDIEIVKPDDTRKLPDKKSRGEEEIK